MSKWLFKQRGTLPVYKLAIVSFIVLLSVALIGGCHQSQKQVVDWNKNPGGVSETQLRLADKHQEMTNYIKDKKVLDEKVRAYWATLEHDPDYSMRNMLTGQYILAVGLKLMSKDEAISKCREMAAKSEGHPEVFDSCIEYIRKMDLTKSS